MAKTGKPKDVEAYIASTPKEVQGKLRDLRGAIRAAAPNAEERISYGMPYYAYKGRLAYFRLSKYHIGLYIPTPVIEAHIRELQGYEASGATLRLPRGKKIPVGLIKKLIRARVKKNKARAGKNNVR